MELDISSETMALDVISSVGPGGHYLSQKHTRKHMRHALQRSLAQHLDSMGNYRDPLEVAHEKIEWILKNHQPEPLDDKQQTELKRILKTAENELA